MLTVRLSREMEEELERLAAMEDKTRSQIVKAALEEYFRARSESGSAYSLGKDLFGIAGSGDTDRSATRRQRLKKRLREKHAH